MNGEMRAVQVEDKNAAIETTRREKAVPSEPGSVGCEFPLGFRGSRPPLISWSLQLPCLLLLSRFAFTRDRRSRLEIRKLLRAVVLWSLELTPPSLTVSACSRP